MLTLVNYGIKNARVVRSLLRGSVWKLHLHRIRASRSLENVPSLVSTWLISAEAGRMMALVQGSPPCHTFKVRWIWARFDPQCSRESIHVSVGWEILYVSVGWLPQL